MGLRSGREQDEHDDEAGDIDRHDDDDHPDTDDNDTSNGKNDEYVLVTPPTHTHIHSYYHLQLSPVCCRTNTFSNVSV